MANRKQARGKKPSGELNITASISGFGDTGQLPTHPGNDPAVAKVSPELSNRHGGVYGKKTTISLIERWDQRARRDQGGRKRIRTLVGHCGKDMPSLSHRRSGNDWRPAVPQRPGRGHGISLFSLPDDRRPSGSGATWGADPITRRVPLKNRHESCPGDSSILLGSRRPADSALTRLSARGSDEPRILDMRINNSGVRPNGRSVDTGEDLAAQLATKARQLADRALPLRSCENTITRCSTHSPFARQPSWSGGYGADGSLYHRSSAPDRASRLRALLLGLLVCSVLGLAAKHFLVQPYEHSQGGGKQATFDILSTMSQR